MISKIFISTTVALFLYNFAQAQEASSVQLQTPPPAPRLSTKILYTGTLNLETNNEAEARELAISEASVFCANSRNHLRLNVESLRVTNIIWRQGQCTHVGGPSGPEYCPPPYVGTYEFKCKK